VYSRKAETSSWSLMIGWTILDCPVVWYAQKSNSLGTIVLGTAELGNSLGSLRDSMLGELTRKHKTNSSLDFAGRKGCLLVVGGKLSSLGGNSLEDIVDEGVHDGHALLGDTSVRVHLLEDLVDVRRIRFSALLSLLAGGGLLRCLGGLLGWCLGHVETLSRLSKIVSI